MYPESIKVTIAFKEMLCVERGRKIFWLRIWELFVFLLLVFWVICLLHIVIVLLWIVHFILFSGMTGFVSVFVTNQILILL